MKIRNDFVSNSSSCSFVITAPADVSKAFEVICNTFDESDTVPYDMDLDVYISTKNKHFKDLEIELTGHSDWSPTYRDYQTHEIVEKDPEELGWDRINMSLGSFICKVTDANSDTKRLCEMIESIEFECDDYDYGKLNVLSLLYAFFNRNGCNPNTENSNYDFLGIDQPLFLKKLIEDNESSESKS